MRRVLIAALLALGCSTATSAQTNAAYTFFGTDCQSSIWPPTPFLNLSLPRIGTTLSIQTHSSWGGIGGSGDVFLVSGISRTSYNGVPLPFDMGALTNIGLLFCGNLYVSPDVIQRMPYGGFGPVLTTVSYPIPNLPALIGARVYQQVLEHRTAPNDNEFFFTRAGEALIGV